MKTDTDKARGALAKAQADLALARQHLGELTRLHITRTNAQAAHSRAMAEHLTLMQRADLGEDVKADLVRIREEIAQAKADGALRDVSDDMRAAADAEPAAVAAVEAAVSAVLEAEARSLAQVYAAAVIEAARIEAKVKGLHLATYGQITLAGAGSALAGALRSDEPTVAKIQADAAAMRIACASVIDGLRSDANFPIPTI